MPMLMETPSLPRTAARSELARERVQAARAALADCRLCAYDCGVNRLAGEQGLCHAGAAARVFSAQVEVSDELELIPTFAIALSGCDLRCDFCITGKESWNARAGEAAVARQIASRARAALRNGARTIMVLGGEPTIHLPAALEIVAELPDEATLVWKTNAHGSAEARALLDGLFEVWVADYKFGSDRCAERLAKVPDYQRVVRENLVWASDRTELIVRHVLMPDHVECCWAPVAEWLADALPGGKVNLRAGFWPGFHAGRHPELRRTPRLDEIRRAWEIAERYQLNLVP
jgi:putative pyruvate formate lyase activating enzyme